MHNQTNNNSTISQQRTAFQNHLRQLFNDCDIDQNGSLTREEFRQLCSKIGFTQEAAEEAFRRLDCDCDDRISFEEFVAGFNQYQTSSSSTTNHHSNQDHGQQQLHPTSNGSGARSPARLSPVASRVAIHRPPPTPGSITLGSHVPARFHPSATAAASSAANKSSGSTETTSGKTYSSTATTSSENFSTDSNNLLNFNPSSSSSTSYHHHHLSSSSNLQQSTSAYNNNNNDNLVIYSSDLLTSQADQATGSQYNSLISQTGGASGSSLTQASCLNVQDLLDCVQKLQNENQQLSQIFFKDKRQREELISQLGEEFDQQVKQVEDAANKRARDELEAEKRRLREMMQEEREQLQHHYKTIERMSNLVKNVYEERKSQNPDGSDVNNSIDLVKSQLEDTYEENKQLKKSLLDTKTDVAMIWKEMGKLKKKYEEQLSSAYERNEETKTECDHIKKQLYLMKDSNRKLQDASDVITSYITDKVDPVIKIATEQTDGTDFPDGDSPDGLKINHRLLMSNNRSANNSRRGSILSDYLGDETSTLEDHCENSNTTNFGHQLQIPGKPEAELQTSCQQATDKNPKNNSPQFMHSDDSEINDWLSQPQRASPSPEPRLTAILRRSGLNRDDSRASSSSGGSSGGQTSSAAGNEDKYDDSQRYPSRQSGRKVQSGKNGANRSQVDDRNLMKQRLQSIDLHSDVDEPLSSKKHDTDPVAKPRGSNDTKTGASNDVVVSMVEPADGPPVATYDIILVGDSFVGKSSLASRFMEGSFSRSVISTTSIDFKTKNCKVDGINYTINLWDTAGQERFRSITASYFRKAKGIILMYDVTEKHTYLNIRNWMSTISNSAAESVAVLLLANKIDLREIKGPDRCVPTEEGERLALEYGILFLETSVKSGTNLDSSMANLIRQMVKNCAPQQDENQDSDRIKLHSRARSSCMPKHC